MHDVGVAVAFVVAVVAVGVAKSCCKELLQDPHVNSWFNFGANII